MSCIECGEELAASLAILCRECYGARPGVNGLRLVVRPGGSLPNTLRYDHEASRTRFIGIRGDGSVYYSFDPPVYAGATSSLDFHSRTPSPLLNGRPTGPSGITNHEAFTRWFKEADSKYTVEQMRGTLRPGRLVAEQRAMRDELARCVDHMWHCPRIAEHHSLAPGLRMPSRLKPQKIDDLLFTNDPDLQQAAKHYRRSSCANRTEERDGERVLPGLYRRSDLRPNTEALAAYLGCDPTTVRALRRRGAELRNSPTVTWQPFGESTRLRIQGDREKREAARDRLFNPSPPALNTSLSYPTLHVQPGVKEAA